MTKKNVVKKIESSELIGKQVTLCLETGETISGIVSKMNDEQVWIKESDKSKLKVISKDEVKSLELDE